MVVPDVEQAKRRLQDILRRAQKLEIPTQEVISTRTARKLLARTRNILTWTIWISVFVILLSGVVYARWPTRPTRQDVETVRTVLRRTVSIEIYLLYQSSNISSIISRYFVLITYFINRSMRF
ncbi:hypothetical protein X777_11689 [Ooceraea biroi]|uniref:Uncharacterized protein n=1 Tax=Ooceraea biroi TaxID=2015173 RepID=A0A026W1T0_OOCBI|nr:hypothetical protein X777_11689 [Ooceraea biroi]